MIELFDVWRLYRMGHAVVNALAGVHLKIGRGEFVSVVGPSGSGKTTLLNIVGGLDSPTSGRVMVEDLELNRANDTELSSYRNKSVGFIFQTFHLQPTYTALENVALPLVFARVPPDKRKKMAGEALASVGMSKRLKHRPNQLSGGERQRVAIARALVNSPGILLADEPTGNLDSKTGEQIATLLTGLSKDLGITLILVTHDREIASHAGRIVHMLDGQIVEADHKEEVL